MTTATYNRIADTYQVTFGEPLVADAQWVEPLYDACLVAVEMQNTEDDQGPTLRESEAVRRTAAVIALITYGEGVLVR